MASHPTGSPGPRLSRRRVSFSPEGGVSRIPGHTNDNATPFGPRRWKRVVLPNELPSLRETSAETCTSRQPEVQGAEKEPCPDYIVTPSFRYLPPLKHNLSESSASYDKEPDDLVEMMQHSLHLANQTPSIISKLDAASKVRDASSSYGSKDGGLVRIKSPASPPSQNTLNEPNISRYSEANDRLSNLQSSPRESSDCSTIHDAAEEAAATANQWKSEPRLENTTYSEHELNKSDEEEVLPSDSISQCQPPAPEKVKGCPRCQCTNRVIFERTNIIKDQYDGGGDTAGFESPQFGTKLHPINFQDNWKFSHKRKSSLISLKSISSHIPKKAKKLRGFANDVIQGGTIRFNKLKSKLKKQNEHNRSNFEAWKATRRRERPGDPIKGKPQPSYAMFNLEKSVHGGQDEWWKEGVRRYRAPSWMVFGTGTQATA